MEQGNGDKAEGRCEPNLFGCEQFSIAGELLHLHLANQLIELVGNQEETATIKTLRDGHGLKEE